MIATPLDAIIWTACTGIAAVVSVIVSRAVSRRRRRDHRIGVRAESYAEFVRLCDLARLPFEDVRWVKVGRAGGDQGD